MCVYAVCTKHKLARLITELIVNTVYVRNVACSERAAPFTENAGFCQSSVETQRSKADKVTISTYLARFKNGARLSPVARGMRMIRVNAIYICNVILCHYLTQS